MKTKITPRHEVDLEASLVTSKGEMITSGLRVHGDLPSGESYTETTTIDQSDVISLMLWLDEKAPLFYATTSLRKSSEDMREALMDIFAALGNAND